MATAQVSQNRVYLFRLQTLIIDGGTTVVRNIFDEKSANVPLNILLHNEKTTINRLRAGKTITRTQFDLLYPQSGQSPTTADFDLTLSICLLRNLKCCGLNKHFAWNAIPQAGDNSLEADICRLRMFRNEIAHISSTTSITQNTFTHKWLEIEQVLNRLNTCVQNPVQNLQQQFNAYKNSPLDEEAEKRIDGEIKKWRKFEKGLESEVQLVMKDVKEVKHEVGNVKEEVHDVAEKVDAVQEKIDELENEKRAQGGSKKAVGKASNFIQRFFERRDRRREEKKLKDDLAAFYKTRYSTIPLSPLVEGHDTPLVDFYILPEMNFIDKQKKPGEEETKTPVESLSDVFKSENSCEIYLTADAGFGKTAFSKYLAVTWCQAHRPEKKYKKYFSEDAIKAMRDFEFLFLVLLRDSSYDCSIDDLIMNQIIQNVSRSSEMTIDYLQGILHRRKSLIILDGLDEWIHPEKKCTREPKIIPHRNAREKCVILTTTRPWKLSVLNLKTSEIGKKVELVKLTSESAQILEERAISKIKNLDIAEAKLLAKQLNKKVQENKLEDLESVPLLTMYLICLWCDNIPLGKSKCGLYASIIELLLSRTISKHLEVELTCEPSQSDIPQCFSEHEHCTKYSTYLKALGQLAFETLFSETKESTLVFSKSVADKYLSPNYLKLSLDSGILTQSTEKTLTKQISKCSFSHKTVQEFFCALYISCQNESDVNEIFLKECKSVQSILDMSTVLVFVSGMNGEIISSISRNFMSVISEDTRTSEYRTTTDWDCEPLKDIQDMYISCMKENTSDKELKICCQDFFFSEDCIEEKYFKHLARLAVHNQTNMASINIDTDSGPSLREIIDSCALHELFQINKIYYRGDLEQTLLPVLFNKSPKCLTVSSPGCLLVLGAVKCWKHYRIILCYKQFISAISR
ncbi:uncharacterized protein LOC123539385 [Mercenaria mercenaria]|uniref:uncharacterized protein LOC123539385 n=1 Tax=Mercenaria mercenaria TaxID=6596 RepID=UPI00234F260E|nr:uncharacterized protein LOC123539385 [Mercenaria mercenaria]